MDGPEEREAPDYEEPVSSTAKEGRPETPFAPSSSRGGLRRGSDSPAPSPRRAPQVRTDSDVLRTNEDS